MQCHAKDHGGCMSVHASIAHKLCWCFSHKCKHVPAARTVRSTSASPLHFHIHILGTVCRARTGSGKTLAYLLPVLHRLLAAADEAAAAGATAPASSSFRALILVPTRELCEQVRGEAQAVAQHCGADISVTALVAEGGSGLKRAVAAAGQLVVATPGGRVWG